VLRRFLPFLKSKQNLGVFAAADISLPVSSINAPDVDLTNEILESSFCDLAKSTESAGYSFVKFWDIDIVLPH
jgi:hypothetical protein